MNKSNNKKFIGIFIIAILLFLVVNISAEDLSINETIGKEANCSEELIKCVEVYNELLEDFHDGINCGTAFNIVKGMNEALSEERDNCREEIGEIKVYRVGFFILLGVLIITSIVILFKGIRQK